MNIRHIFNKGYNFVFILCLLFIGVESVNSQVTVPSPSIYLAFDTDNPGYESVTKQSCLVSGSHQRTADRFGNPQRAVRFNNKGSGIRCTLGDINSAHTISFWAYINEPSEIPVGPVPFSSADMKYEFYNWTNANGFILRGLGRRKATVGFNRYIPKPDGSKVPWYLWAYKRAQFDELGWYHIFVVQGAHYTRLIMYKPNSGRVFYYTWLGAQDFASRNYLCIGGFGEHNPLNGSYDDFKVYNAELTDDQIETLHTAEYPKGEYVLITNKHSGKRIVVSEPSFDDYALIIQRSTVYKTQRWYLEYAGQGNEYRMVNPRSGKVMVVKNASTSVGADIIQFKQNGTDNEVWILEYSDSDTKYFRLKNKKSGKYLAVNQDATSDNAKLIQANIGAQTVYWKFESAVPIIDNDGIEEGYYRIKNKNSGLYLDVQNRSEAYNTMLVQEKNAGDLTSTNLWYIGESVGGSYFMRNLVTQQLVRIKGNDTSLEPIVQGEIGTKSEGNWLLLKTGVEGEYKLRNVNNYMFAVVKDAAKTEHHPIVQYESADTDNAIWILERYYYSDSPIKTGSYYIQNVNSRMKLAVDYASLDDGAPIIQYPSEGSNFVFEILEIRDGYVIINHPYSQKKVQVHNKSLAEGERIIQYGYKGPGTNGYWRIEKSSTLAPVHYYIYNMRSGLKMSIANASLKAGGRAVQSGATGAHTEWNFYPVATTRSVEPADRVEKTAGKYENLIVNADLNNDIISAQYNALTFSKLTFKIFDTTGKLIHMDERTVSGSDNMVAIQGFRDKLSPKSMYLISVVSSDGRVNYSTKSIYK